MAALLGRPLPTCTGFCADFPSLTVLRHRRHTARQSACHPCDRHRPSRNPCAGFLSGRPDLGQLVVTQGSGGQLGGRMIAAALAAALVLAPAASRAADVLTAPPPPPAAAAVMVPALYDPTRWEVRFGG